jgi:hypothetical protein
MILIIVEYVPGQAQIFVQLCKIQTAMLRSFNNFSTHSWHVVKLFSRQLGPSHGNTTIYTLFCLPRLDPEKLFRRSKFQTLKIIIMH